MYPNLANRAVFSECIPLQSAWETVLGRPLTVTFYEDNQAVLAIIKKGYSSKFRHLPKTHKINVASVSDLFRDSQFQTEYPVERPRSAEMETSLGDDPHATSLSSGSPNPSLALSRLLPICMCGF